MLPLPDQPDQANGDGGGGQSRQPDLRFGRLKKGFQEPTHAVGKQRIDHALQGERQAQRQKYFFHDTRARPVGAIKEWALFPGVSGLRAVHVTEVFEEFP